MIALTWTLLGFLLGSLPLSVWLGKLVLHTSGWAVMAALLTLLGFLLAPALHWRSPGLITGLTLPLFVAWAGTVTIVAWAHRADLRQRPALRSKARR